ncbi:unnamed protein product [Vicia faba]|uniref:Uncharacterized protein n=1 Tax=Vicia faba TaxID=3906 RepID=A0AAV1APC7_VICFA|nr:unnamed protein product [Vicia faba]
MKHSLLPCLNVMRRLSPLRVVLLPPVSSTCHNHVPYYIQKLRLPKISFSKLVPNWSFLSSFFIPIRMKAGFSRLKGKEISLISIVLMCSTIILWSWERTPGLSAFLPPQSPLQLYSDHLVSRSSVKAPDPHKHVSEHDSSMPKKKTTDEPEEKDLGLASQTISAQSSSEKSMGESNTKTTSHTEQIPSSVSNEETKHENILEAGKSHGIQTSSSLTTFEAKSNETKGEKNSKQEEPKIDLVTNISQKTSLPIRKESWNNATENNGTILLLIIHEILLKHSLSFG